MAWVQWWPLRLVWSGLSFRIARAITDSYVMSKHHDIRETGIWHKDFLNFI